uniref:Uncharacterized protein n=1 Tax=Helicotheca tamesis TaxID=374047 RepID=A0A7S2E130_9STRA|mmetsp:Transcript_11043/g.15320  ORF Transcript_11043/g.15320 Transcript_11043/m.15320 type:complete len:139 (+) Transcript_11043:97-513(+)
MPTAKSTAIEDTDKGDVALILTEFGQTLSPAINLSPAMEEEEDEGALSPSPPPAEDFEVAPAFAQPMGEEKDVSFSSPEVESTSVTPFLAQTMEEEEKFASSSSSKDAPAMTASRISFRCERGPFTRLVPIAILRLLK